MSTFELSIGTLLTHEGGWCNVPGDRGGETNFGWSMLTIKRLGLTPQQLGISGWYPGCLKEMQQSTAILLYRIYFWDKEGYGRIANQIAATKALDCSVNCSPDSCHRIMQLACNDSYKFTPVDGLLGPNTIATINSCDPKLFLAAFCNEQKWYYDKLILKYPNDKQFEANWHKRAAWGYPQ
jgi:lysozyme family protein